MIPDAAVTHYKQMQSLQGLVVMAAADLWSEVGVADLTGSWARQIPAMASVLSAVQVKAATAGASYGAATLAAQGLYEAPEHFVNASAFSGAASDGRTLAGLLYSPVPHTKALIAGGMDPRLALEAGGKHLTTLTRTQVADAGRGAAGVDVATRRNTGFVRMLNPPSCSRCSVLAGRFYRWNNGFDRHPKCDCVHVQTSVEAAQTEGLMHDPYEYFHSLSQADQDKAYTKAGAQAIRDGGDLFQVVNSRRGMKPGGLVTTEGATRRGNFGNTRGPRLTPEAIYGKGLSRAETLRELERYGYILPGGQNPLGVLRGQAEGFGQMGRGGTRVGAREAVLRARESGVRDPLSRATMTAAERRTFDAQANWDAVRAGRNPYTNRKNAPVTPEVAARAELAYRKELVRKVEPRAGREVVAVRAKPLPSAIDSHLDKFSSYVSPHIDGDDDDMLAGVMAHMPSAKWSTENAQVKAALFIGDNSNALRDAAKRLGMPEADVLRKANTAVQKVVDGSSFAIKIGDDKLASVLAEGRFKSLFETGASGGNTNQKLRSGLEEALFGYRDDTPAGSRPIYGFVDVQSSGTRRIDKDTYGGIKVQLKESVRARATVTVGDSIDARYVTAPSRATNIQGFTGRVSQLEGSKQDYEKFFRSGDFHEHDYIEAQFHGGLSADDIASVVFKGRPSTALRQALESKGIPWTIEG